MWFQFVNGNPKAQKYLLGAFEMLVGKSYPEELMPKSAHILKAFYDNDILDEEVLINWSEKVCDGDCTNVQMSLQQEKNV